VASAVAVAALAVEGVAVALAGWQGGGGEGGERARECARVLRHWGEFAALAEGSADNHLDPLFDDPERLPEAAAALRALRGFARGAAVENGGDSDAEDGFVMTYNKSRAPAASQARERDISERIEGYAAIVRGRLLARFRSCAERMEARGMAKYARAMRCFPNGESECAAAFVDARSEIGGELVAYDGPSDAPLPDPRPMISRLDVKRFTVDRARPDGSGGGGGGGGAAGGSAAPQALLRGLDSQLAELATATATLQPLLERVFGGAGGVIELYAQRFIERRTLPYVRGLLAGLHPERAAECCVAVAQLAAGEEAVMEVLAGVSPDHGGTSLYLSYEIALIEETYGLELARLEGEGGGMSVEMVLNLVHANSAALSRTRIVHPNDPLPPTILFDILLGQVVGHVSAALETGMGGLKGKSPESALPSLFALVRSACQIVQLVEQHCSGAFADGEGGGPPTQRHRQHVAQACRRRKDAALGSLEAGIKGGLQLGMGIVVAKFEKMLGTMQVGFFFFFLIFNF
jgi:hypothetical protein